MKVGDLIRIKQDEPDFTRIRGKDIGIVVHEYQTCSEPKLFKILWPDLEIECLYRDEVEYV